MENFELQFSELEQRIATIMKNGADENILFGYLNKALDDYVANDLTVSYNILHKDIPPTT